VKIALASFDQLWGDKIGNYLICRKLAKEAAAQGAELLVFPEMTLTGFFLDLDSVLEPEGDSETIRCFQELASDFQLTAIFGVCVKSSRDGLPRNYMCIARPDGSSSFVYAKIHTFSHAGENKVMSNGEKISFLDIGGERFGAAICYDLRFPALFTALSENCIGTIVIANWPTSRSNHWFALMKARAIENQMFMVGANRVGTDGNGICYSRTSCIVKPTGDFETPIFTKRELDIFEVDISTVKRYRETFPTFGDRRYFQTSDTWHSHPS
jgi:predicted amidohydrolase